MMSRKYMPKLYGRRVAFLSAAMSPDCAGAKDYQNNLDKLPKWVQSVDILEMAASRPLQASVKTARLMQDAQTELSTHLRVGRHLNGPPNWTIWGCCFWRTACFFFATLALSFGAGWTSCRSPCLCVSLVFFLRLVLGSRFNARGRSSLGRAKNKCCGSAQMNKAALAR